MRNFEILCGSGPLHLSSTIRYMEICILSIKSTVFATLISLTPVNIIIDKVLVRQVKPDLKGTMGPFTNDLIKKF